MAEKKSLVEETLLQMKSLENVISENAKGILHSTMKEEIGQLVKESLKEDEEDESEDMETEMYKQDEVDMEDEESEDEDEESEMNMTSIGGMDDEDDEPIDLTDSDISDEDLLKVFQAMGPNDGIMVKKDGNTIDLEDTNKDSHYKISLGEGFDDEFGMSDDSMMGDEDEPMMDDEDDDDSDSGMTSMDDEDEPMMDDEDEPMMDDEDEDFEEISLDGIQSEFDESEDEELMFEIEMDTDEEEEEEEEDEMIEGDEYESDENLEEGFKAKGTGMGKAKFQYKKSKGGFKEDKKQGTRGVGMGKPKFEFKEGMKSLKPKSVGMGKPKFEYKEGEDMDKMPTMKKGGETAEASRTLGAGKRFGRNGLPKPKAAPRHLNVEAVEREMKLLREKNEEYRKALNVFRSKLNEVAVFNSNLAYATRLFTEHSTTKHEKINILRRFDSIESLKESKTLYKTIKDEISSQGGNKLMKESIQEKIEKTPSSGSAANLIESKTYENPQFMRMKDLMSKMNIIK